MDANYHYWMDPSGWRGASHPPNNGFGGGFNASRTGFGFDRNVASPYARTYQDPAYAASLASPETTPQRLLLTFHHLPYEYDLGGGQGTLLQAFYRQLLSAAAAAAQRVDRWEALAPPADVDALRHELVLQQLRQGLDDALNFTDTLVGWFTNVSGQPPALD